MRRVAGTLLGKSVSLGLRLRGKSGGQALPGYIVEKFIPGYLRAMLAQLPEGVILVTGTNGKTTTTKMVVELLRASGKKVLTNPTGSNLTRGLISTTAERASLKGRLPYDLAVFEIDEAWASRFARSVEPRWVLALNVSRDQLDRFGEVDTVARLVGKTMLSATTGIVTNADDQRLVALARNAGVTVKYFGVEPDLLKFFPRDDEIVSVAATEESPKTSTVKPGVSLVNFSSEAATYRVDDQLCQLKLAVTGQHNFVNAAAALALARELLPAEPLAAITEILAKIAPAFGRGQVYKLNNGSLVQLALVKNPASFRQALASYLDPKASVMIAVNDQIADSRDVSWLWDVDFSNLQSLAAKPCLTGSRAADMALRLSYDEVEHGWVEARIPEALANFCASPNGKIIFATYTAMLRIHKLLEAWAERES